MDQIPGLSDLGRYGVLGTILVILSWVAWKLKGELTETWKARLEDWKAVSEVLQSSSVALREISNATEARNRASETQSRTLEIAALAQTQMAAEIQRLRETNTGSQNEIKNLQGEVKNLRDDLMRKRS